MNNKSEKISTIRRIRAPIILVLLLVNSITIYYRNRIGEYRRYLRHVLHAPGIETIHNLRLVIKKLRAIYYLATSHDPHSGFELHFENFTKIFKAAGRLRDIDITLKCLREILPDDEKTKKISGLLNKKRKNHSRDLQKIVKNILSKEKLYDTDILHSLKEIKLLKIKNFLASLHEDIARESKKKIDTERLHGIRKLAKEYLYLSRAGGKTIIQITKENLLRLAHLQKQIGKWHDHVIAVETIEVFAKKDNHILYVLKKEEKKLLKKVVKKVHNQ